jgi:TetR/AcrR family transcriptional regulator, transcriptional repressor for nem operon
MSKLVGCGVMGKESVKDVLLKAGRDLFLERGYNHAGIEAIVQSAGVPKGSFYHYFSSKEDFGLEVLHRFAAAVDAELERCLADESVPPLERLRRFGEAMCERLESRRCRSGCLVGNLSQEMADQSEAFRMRLETIFRGWAGRIAACLSEAQARGDVAGGVDAGELAEFWICGWQGALIRAKTLRSTAPLRTFLALMFGHVLCSPEPGIPIGSQEM